MADDNVVNVNSSSSSGVRLPLQRRRRVNELPVTVDSDISDIASSAGALEERRRLRDANRQQNPANQVPQYVIQSGANEGGSVTSSRRSERNRLREELIERQEVQRIEDAMMRNELEAKRTALQLRMLDAESSAAVSQANSVSQRDDVRTCRPSPNNPPAMSTDRVAGPPEGGVLRYNHNENLADNESTLANAPNVVPQHYVQIQAFPDGYNPDGPQVVQNIHNEHSL